MTIFRAVVADDTGELTVVIYNSSYQFDALVLRRNFYFVRKGNGKPFKA